MSFSDVAPTFDQGAHHPTVLVVLQAMVALIGEVRAHLLPCPRARHQMVSHTPSQLLGSILGMGQGLRDGARQTNTWRN